MSQRPDTGTRLLVATIALILVIAWITGGHAVWTGQPFPAVR